MCRLVLLILGILSVIAAAASCPDRCSLLGDCNADGTCTCDPGWKGENCGVLDLGPAKRLGGGFRNSTFASWGGTVVKVGETYHMWLSAMANNCTLREFSTNSLSAHASAATPDGPFAFADVALPPFHHSTAAIPAGANTSELLMFTIGKTTGGPLWTCNATFPPPPLPNNCTADMAALGCVQGGGAQCKACITEQRHSIPNGACWAYPCPSTTCFARFVKQWCGKGEEMETDVAVEAISATAVEEDVEEGDASLAIGPHDYMSISTAPGVAGARSRGDV